MYANADPDVAMPAAGTTFFTPITGKLNVLPGDIITINAGFQHQFTTGSNLDPLTYKVVITSGGGCTNSTNELPRGRASGYHLPKIDFY